MPTTRARPRPAAPARPSSKARPGSGAGSAPASKAAPRSISSWLLSWAVFVGLSLLHVSALVWATRQLGSDLATLAVLAAPALVLLAARPGPTLRRGYRWLALWALAFTSVVSTPVLVLGQAWVLRQAWLESGTTAAGLWQVVRGRVGRRR